MIENLTPIPRPDFWACAKCTLAHRPNECRNVDCSGVIYIDSKR